MSMIQEFKTFAMRGNVIDLAVGIVIGAAFGKIVSAFVDHVIMPVLGLFVGGIDFSTLAITLREAADGKPPLVLGYGAALQAVFDFVLIAFAVFLLVKAVNKLKLTEEAKPAPVAEVPADVKLLGEIRDLLKTARA
jgi:large conductance mechanosensitive channel